MNRRLVRGAFAGILLATPGAAHAQCPESAAAGPLEPVSRVLALVPCTSVDVVDLGEVALDRNGRSRMLAVTLPADIVSVTVSAVGDPRYAYRVAEAIDPDGVSVVSRDRSQETQGRSTLLLPNSPDLRVRSGRWRFRLEGDDADGSMHVKVLVKRGARPRRAILPVHVHVAGAPYEMISAENVTTVNREWTVAGARKNENLQKALAGIRATYAKVGIDVRVMSYHQVSPELDNLRGETERLFAAGQRSRPGLNLFFVASIGSVGYRMSIGGLSPVIGGPALLRNGSSAGVVIAQNDAESMAHDGAHEIAHYLGLRHTNELREGTDRLRGDEDPIADTPTGESASGNVMFPISNGRNVTFTPGQAFVMLGSPVLVSPQPCR